MTIIPSDDASLNTGNPTVDDLIVKAILQAQATNNPPLTAAKDAVKALHAAVLEWNKLVDTEATQ